jgi:endonuclease/exonuclease/phosphatase family metal-dependent hydrolase
MELKFYVWNMNFWMNPLRAKMKMNEKAKNQNEIDEWIKISTNILQKEQDINFLLLQEVSFRLYKPNHEYKSEEHCLKKDRGELHYHEIPNKGSRWGLIIDSNMTISEQTTFTEYNKLSLISYNFKLINNDIITVVNLYANNQENDWKTILDVLSKIIEQNNNHLILLAGDFNASDKFEYKNTENDKKIFEYIQKKLNLFDCTESIPLEDRSTMIDPKYNRGRGFQNDYIFINKPYDRDTMEVKICKDNREISEHMNLYDHWPIKFSIKV